MKRKWPKAILDPMPVERQEEARATLSEDGWRVLEKQANSPAVNRALRHFVRAIVKHSKKH